MKTILIDAVYAFVVQGENGFEIYKPMYEMLEGFENPKILLTGANDEEVIKFGLDKIPYPVFTLKHNPEKTNPEYFKKLLEHFNLKTEEVIYFEHNIDAVKSAESVGIKSYFYDSQKKDLVSLKEFIENNL
jgi:HAD superfamily hydrolase (TIGR01509 family)